MKKLLAFFFAISVVLSVTGVASSTIITLGDGSSYEVYLEDHVDNTWTYFVREVSGKDLSHWGLGIPSCLGYLISANPPAETADGSTGFEGIKWDVKENFSEGTFSITLNDEYPEATTVQAHVKAGTGNEGTGEVTGPNCNPFTYFEDTITPESKLTVTWEQIKR
ncbi:MAG: hypothetical protein ACYS6K_14375 [Planctomycetota bacterium]|jgi:hypothetical protein